MSNRPTLCVPRWDEREVLKLGAVYEPSSQAFVVPEHLILDDFWVWLPLKYKKSPALLPEMLPAQTFEANLRKALPAADWDNLRRYCYKAAGHRCEICGEKGKPTLECHEKWEFDDTWCVQKLSGLISLCPPCHKAHHLGYAKTIGLYDDVVRKMKAVNGWSDAQVKAAIQSAYAAWEQRSQFHWEVDLSWLTEGEYHLVYRLGG